MKHFLTAITLVLAAGCNGVQPSPGGQTILLPTFPSPVTPVPPGPHFALEIHGPGGPVYEGQDWIGNISVSANPNILRPELPANIRTFCGSESRTVLGFQGTMRLSCLLPVGSHGVTVQALMADGRVFSTGTTAVVSHRPVQVVPLLWDVFETGKGYTDVSFGVQAFEGAEYHWVFGDGDSTTTRDNGINHRYTGGRADRQASVQVTKDGRTLATGSVVGRW